ncbi:MAG: cysteine desulfurase family protein [Pseudomonadota bacterium]
MTARVYLDHNATSPLRPAARETMQAALGLDGNASSVHAEGRKARGLIETARAQLSAALNAPANGIVFTSGGTEANNLALYGAVGRGATRLFVSAIEHDATLCPAADLGERNGVSVETFPVLASGLIDVAWLADRLDGYDLAHEGDFLVAVMLANNETGVVQPLDDISDIVRRAGGLLFVDAAQGLGRTPLDFLELDADFLSVSGHKFGGPQGSGALVTRPGVAFAPRQRGGGQEHYRRAGTENVAAIAGLGAAAEAAAADAPVVERLSEIRDGMANELTSRFPEIIVHGAAAPRLANTLCFSAPGFSSETQVMALDLAGVAVSAGSACSSGKVKPSHVLRAMGADEAVAGSAVRVSLGWNSTSADAERFVEAWSDAYGRVRDRAPVAAA